MPMKIEPWPGGRWYRDLGDNNGHFWGHRAGHQAADAARNHRSAVHVVSGRLERAVPPERMSGGTLIKFHHTALGLIQDEHRQGVVQGLELHSRSHSHAGRSKALGATRKRLLCARCVASAALMVGSV